MTKSKRRVFFTGNRLTGIRVVEFGSCVCTFTGADTVDGVDAGGGGDDGTGDSVDVVRINDPLKPYGRMGMRVRNRGLWVVVDVDVDSNSIDFDFAADLSGTKTGRIDSVAKGSASAVTRFDIKSNIFTDGRGGGGGDGGDGVLVVTTTFLGSTGLNLGIVFVLTVVIGGIFSVLTVDVSKLNNFVVSVLLSVSVTNVDSKRTIGVVIGMFLSVVWVVVVVGKVVVVV